MHRVFILWLLVVITGGMLQSKAPYDYREYHQRTIEAEELIAANSFEAALEVYEAVFSQYPFIFLRDYKVATQLAWYLGETKKTCHYLKLAIANGWELKSIKKNKFLKGFRGTSDWQIIVLSYDSLHGIFLDRIDHEIRAEVRKMSLADQRKAMGALFRVGSNAQDRFGEKKFAPKNKIRVKGLIEIMEAQGYPGEKLTGFDPWAQGILSRHNSISKANNERDTLYSYLRPRLIKAIWRGEMAPHNFALIDDWYLTVKSGWNSPSYGCVGDLKKSDLHKANQLRGTIGLRKIELRNRLIDIQKQTGINLYLPVWPGKDDKIPLRSDG